MKTSFNLRFAVVTTTVLLSMSLQAADKGKLIFSDDFERNESQEKTDEPGNGWGTNSKSRAKGNKQVDLKNGAMYIYIHKEADHGVSVTHPAEFKDGTVELKFMLENPQDTLGLDFADLQCKEIHAGHLFKVTAGIKKVDIDDMKSGIMNLKFEEAKKAKTLTDEQKKFLATTKKSFPVKLETGKWYALAVQIAGDKVSVTIDGKDVGSFSSEGFAHPTKKMLRLAVPKKATVDEVRIYAKSK